MARVGEVYQQVAGAKGALNALFSPLNVRTNCAREFSRK